ncbi:MAG: cupin protein [Solirubrobacterales bacterium]|nr:cupin protein [Solirubrobacterales bacterium]
MRLATCKDREVRRANVLSDECEFDEQDPPGYRSAFARVGEAVGGEALAVKVYELPPGESMCPYHYEYEEEWLLVLDGAVLVRTPTGEHELQRGEIVCFPPGPAGAHKATNRTSGSARVMMFSSAREPAVAVYPDSDKIGVWPGNADDNVMLRRDDGAVDYWDGER